MPNYTFEDQKTGKRHTEFMSISEREQYLKDNPRFRQVPMTATPLLDPVRLGITKPPADFSKYVLGRIKENTGHTSTIGSRHFDVAREF